jgi:hypothetical protein
VEKRKIFAPAGNRTPGGPARNPSLSQLALEYKIFAPKEDEINEKCKILFNEELDLCKGL